MENTKNIFPFKNVPTATGKYRLYFIDPAGQPQPVQGTGLGLRPFEFVAEFTGRKFVAIKKYTSNAPVLFLVNLHSGTIPSSMPHGTFNIIFDANKQSLFFAPLYSNGKPAVEFSWCLPKEQSPYQAINTPSVTQPGVQSVNATTAVALPVKIDVIEIKPHKPKRKIKQTITDTQIPKRKRGRPRGSKNKPKVITPAVLPKINQKKQNRVSLHRTSKNILNPTYNVYINGRRVATKRLNASAQTFMNDRILVVSYQIPAGLTKQHDVFLPDGTQWQTGLRNRYTNKPLAITNTHESPKGLQLTLSNNNRTIIGESELKRFAPQYFVIENEKQR